MSQDEKKVEKQDTPEIPKETLEAWDKQIEAAKGRTIWQAKRDKKMRSAN